MIMNTAVAVTELFVTAREAGSSFIVLAQCCRLKVSKNVSVSALRGLGLGLVSWQISDVSVSSQSRGIAGRSWSRSRLGPKTECLGLVYIPDLREGGACKLQHCTLGNPTSPFSTILFLHDSDYLCYLRIK